ncbi:IS630 family transposase [Ktedonobacter racemifer]|nr:IS630 family transposase [Ktedonobacter racemifer]
MGESRRRTDEQRGDWRKWRRLRAWKLAQQGWSQKKIAEALGVTEGAVSQWMKRGREQGEEGLHGRITAGPQPQLTEEQLEQLPTLLEQGAEAHGFQGQVWTTKRVAALIKKQFGVRYHPAHMSRLLKQLNYSVQQPIERATQRNEETIRIWKEVQWPKLKKAQQEGRTIIFVDEAGFYLLPTLVRTYSPVGHTPTLRVPLTRDHLSTIGGITPEGRIFMQMQTCAYRAEHVVEFLRMLLRKLSGKLLVIWDGSPIHRAKAIKEFLAAGAARRLHLERLPGYAPELNPQEGVWNLLKRRELKNLCCRNLSCVREALVRAKKRLRHRREILQSCFTHALGEVIEQA